MGKIFDWPGLLLSGLFALFAFVLFFNDTNEPLKSLVAAIFVFLLTWLTTTVVKWIFKMF